MEKLQIAVLFGGVSSEHEISLLSAATVLLGLSPEKYRVLKVGITRDGRWLCTEAEPEQIADGSWETIPGNRGCILSPDRRHHGFLFPDGGACRAVDVVFPMLHGRNGEDGAVQGLLELAGVPYVGCGVTASAVCMDKVIANTVFDACGLPQARWQWCTRAEAADFDALEARLLDSLQYPIFVKPANAGSSVGITKAQDRDSLRQAVRTALAEDDKVVFEQAITGQEVECAVLGNDDIVASTPGEILAGAEFYTYDDKYLDGVSQTLIPAGLAPEKRAEVQAMARRAYRAAGCAGMARCDFFVEKDTGRVLINEINTIPGFTDISMYPKLMEAGGRPLPRLLDRLVELALEGAGV